MTPETDTPRHAAGKYVWIIPAMALLAVLLPGCSGIPDSALVDPMKFDNHACVDLEKVMKTNQKRAHEILELDAKAAREEVGIVIGALSYGPEYKSLRGEMKLIEQVAKRKDCNPPIVMSPEFAADIRTP